MFIVVACSPMFTLMTFWAAPTNRVYHCTEWDIWNSWVKFCNCFSPAYLAKLSIHGNKSMSISKVLKLVMYQYLIHWVFKLPVCTFIINLQTFPLWNQRQLCFVSLKPKSTLQYHSGKFCILYFQEKGYEVMISQLLRDRQHVNPKNTCDHHVGKFHAQSGEVENVLHSIISRMPATSNFNRAE